MKNYLAIFREQDGSATERTAEQLNVNQNNWRLWMDVMAMKGKLAGGVGLTLNGCVLKANGEFEEDIHRNGNEIIGGFLMIRATDLAEERELLKDCPVFDFGGYTEIREMQN